MATVTPYLCLKDAAAAIDWYKQALGAKEVMRFEMPGGGIGHAEIDIAGALVMLSDEWPDGDIYSPETIGGTGTSLMLQIDDCDAWFERAVAAGAKGERPPEDQFYGQRAATFLDPFGHRWSVHQLIEDLSEEEMRRRMDEWTPDQQS
jgi:PhnB protein